jgi:hypothetical protein
MQMRRSGSEKFHRWTTIIPNRKPVICWDAQTNALVARAWGVQDIYQKSYYDFDIMLTFEDIAAIVDRLSAEAIPGVPRVIHEAFKSHLTALIRLLTCASGSVPGPLPEASPPTAFHA